MNQEDSLVQYLNPAVRSYLVNLVGEQDLQDLQYTYLELGYTDSELTPFQNKMMAFTKQELGRLAQTQTPTARLRLVRLCETLVQFYLLNQGGDTQQALAKINTFFPAGLRFSPHSGRLLFFPEQFEAHSELLNEASYALVNQMGGVGLTVTAAASPVVEAETVATKESVAETSTAAEDADSLDEADSEAEDADSEAEDADAADERVLEDAESFEDEPTNDHDERIFEATESLAEAQTAEEHILEDADETIDADFFEVEPSGEPPSLDDVLADLGPPEEPAIEAGLEPELEPLGETKSAIDALAEVKNRRLKLLKKLQQTGS